VNKAEENLALECLEYPSDDDEMLEWADITALYSRFAARLNPELGDAAIAKTQDRLIEALLEAAESGLVELKRGDHFPAHVISAARLTWDGKYHLDRGYPSDQDDVASEVFSRNWTGVSFSTQVIDLLQSEIANVLNRIEKTDLSQKDKSQARSLLRAASALLDAPHPPTALIMRLLGDADRIMNTTSLMIGIAGLLIGFFK
jgi:hypothetical protein